MSSAALLAQHAKEYGIKPGQQVHLLTTFLTVRILFPELTLAQYLERAPALYGANDENRLNPKDALDHWCPTKGSQWPPEKRLALMATYCDYLAGNPPAPVLTLNEAIAYILGDAAAAAATSPPPAPVTPPPVVPPTQTVDVAVPTMPPVQAPPAVEAPPGAAVPIIPVGAQQLEAVVKLTADQRRKIAEYLAMTAPVGPVELGKQLVETVTDMGTFVLHVDVCNGQPKPFVDMFCRDKSGNPNPIADLPPQPLERIEGTYQMLMPGNAVLIINIP